MMSFLLARLLGVNKFAESRSFSILSPNCYPDPHPKVMGGRTDNRLGDTHRPTDSDTDSLDASDKPMCCGLLVALGKKQSLGSPQIVTRYFGRFGMCTVSRD